jgi:hypothetical protein
VIEFKEWLPDQADLGNPGLIEASNVLVGDNMAYTSFLQPSAITQSGSTVGSIPSSGTAGASTIKSGIMISSNEMFVASGTLIFRRVLGVGGPWATAVAASLVPTGEPVRFARHADYVLATNRQNTLLAQRASLGSNFTALSTVDTTPRAAVVGSVGEFVVIGNLYDGVDFLRSYIRWSSIGQPRNWPVPSSSTAVASQAGQQNLGDAGGEVTGIHGGDQFAVVLQTGAITRMTYIGGTSVFQFDQISNKEGSVFEGGSIRVNDLTYFISRSGFMVTDGVSVQPIGYGKVDRYFWRTVSLSVTNDPANLKSNLWCAYDSDRRDIYWMYQTVQGVAPSTVLIYNIPSKRWTRAVVSGHYALMDYVQDQAESARFYLHCVRGSDLQMQSFSGAPNPATLTTGEVEGNEGGYSFLSGVKPIIDATTGAITVAVGTRGDQQEAVTYTSEVSQTPRTRFCDFRSEARYHRARLTIAGTFTAAQGIEIQAEASSGA